MGKRYVRTAGPSRLRVMHIVTRLVQGGAAQVVLSLLRGLRARQVDPILVAGAETGPEGSLWGEADALGIPAIRLPSLVRRIAPLKDYRTVRCLRDIIRAYRPDVVHAHTSKAGFLGCLAARREGVAAVVLAPHGHILGDGAQIPGVPARGLRRRLLAAASRRNARWADAIVAPNDSERLDGIRIGLWDPRAVVTVPNGVDIVRFAPRDGRAARAENGLPQDVPIVGVVARLTREKGVDWAIETLRLLPGALLVIAGDGPERETLETLAASLAVEDRVRFLGMQGAVEVILPAFDVCLVPSRTESHGMVAAEALACQVPVVASAVGGLRSLVSHGETGLLVEPGCIPAYAAATSQLLRDRDLAARFAAAGRARVASAFSREGMVEETLALYRRLVPRRYSVNPSSARRPL